MAAAVTQNVSDPTFYSTIFFDEYIANSTENMTAVPDPVETIRSVNINGILWPILFTTLTIIANLISLMAFGIEKRLRTYNNYFIINLSILDFIAGLLLISRVVHTHIGYYPFSQDICKVASAFQSAIINASNLAVVVICADRHRATYDPINHFISRSKRQAAIKNAIPWIASFAFWYLYTTLPEFINGFDNGRHCVRWYTFYPILNMIPFITLFYLPLFIIAVLYFRILIKINATLGGKNVNKQFAMTDKSRGKITAEFPEMTSAVSSATIHMDLSSNSLDQDEKMKNDNVPNPTKKTTTKRESPYEMRKATRTLLFIIIAFVVSWLPRSIIWFIYSIRPELVLQGLPRPGRLFFGWMSYFNSLLNPLSYAVSQPLFRSTIIKMFLCRRK